MLYGVKHRNLSAMVELNLGLMFSCVFFTAQVGHVNHTHTLHINNSQRKCKYACVHYRRALQLMYNSIVRTFRQHRLT